MRPTVNPVMGWRILVRPYSSGLTRSMWKTAGVIQPPQTLSRGNLPLSRTSTSSPEDRSPQAQEDPAGPAPTIKTSHESMVDPVAEMQWCPRPDRSEPKEFSGTFDPQTRFETVEAHQRRMRQSSPPGKGATFWRSRTRISASLCRKNAQTYAANIPGSWRNGVEDFRHPELQSRKVPVSAWLPGERARRLPGKHAYESTR